MRPVLLLLALSAAPFARGQPAAFDSLRLVAGQEVRVQQPGFSGLKVARVRAVHGDTLVLSYPMGVFRGPVRAVPFERVRRLDVQVGTRSQAREGAIAGGLAEGLLAGIVAVALHRPPGEPCGFAPCLTAGQGLAFTVLGVASGAAKGALVGSAFRVPRWRTVFRR